MTKLSNWWACKVSHAKGKFGLALAHVASKKQKTFLDKFLAQQLGRILDGHDAGADHMQDDIVETGVEFSVEELDTFERG